MLNRIASVLILGAVMVVAGCAVKQPLAQGTWNGTIGGGKTKPLTVRFILEDENGVLVGSMSVQDPVTGEYADDGTLTGTREGTSATWTTETNVVIKGTFEDNKFVGTLEWPADEARPTFPTPLTLSR